MTLPFLLSFYLFSLDNWLTMCYDIIRVEIGVTAIDTLWYSFKFFKFS